MRMIGYYAVHAFKNQLKKIFRTKFLIFILICALVGGVISFGAGMIADKASDYETEEDEETIIEEETEADGEISDDEAIAMLEDPDQLNERINGVVKARGILELIIGAIVLAIFVYEILSADKRGAAIFLPADVNLLFPSPHRPQTVLFFRLMMQAGVILFSSIYLVFQMPNLAFQLDLSALTAVALILVWFLTIFVGRLLQVLAYTVTSTHSSLKKYLTPVVYAGLAILAGAFLLFWKKSGDAPLDAARAFFNAPVTRWIPVWGWLKGIVLFTAEEQIIPAAVCLGLMLLLIIVMVFAIWHIKADFYEDAMIKSEKTAEILEAAQSGRSVTRVKERKKSDRIRRDGMNHGWGANVFFFKPLYNRFRLAKAKIFTKTTITYLAAVAAMSVLCRVVIGTNSVIPVILVLGAFIFYRAMGNPLEEDIEMAYFRLIPESSFRKVLFSLLGGLVNSFLDMLPALILGVILMKASPLTAICWLPFLLSVDFYATNTSACINQLVPTSVDKSIRQMVTVMFIYFGLVPDIGILAVGFVTNQVGIAALVATLVNIVLGFIFLTITASILEPKGGSPVYAKSGGTADALTGSAGAGFEGMQETEGRTMEERIGCARRAFSRMGIALAVIFAVSTGIQILMTSSLSLMMPGWQDHSLLYWSVIFLPIYVIGMPLGMLIMRRIPANRPGPGRLGFGRLLGCFFIGLFLMYTGNIIGTLIASLFSGGVPTNPLAELLSGKSLFLQILVTVFIGPMFEELIFRRFLIDRMNRYGGKLACLTSAFCFGLFHANLQQFIYATALGLLLGYIYLKTGKLRYTIGLHIAVNLTGNLVSLLLVNNSALSDMASFSVTNPSDIAQDAGQLSQMMEALFTPAFVGMLVMTVLIFVFYLTGLALFIVNVRKVRFEPAPEELPKGIRFKTAWLNIGMILFTVLTVGMIVLTLLLQ